MKKDINHLAIIMDGNGRWATKRGLSRSMGHKKGADTLKKVMEYVYDNNIKVFSVFAFSTENWNRPKEEVDYLMNLFTKFFDKYFSVAEERNIKVVFSGILDKLPVKVKELIYKIQNKTKNNESGIFNICINYGGTSEIINATKKICLLYNDKKITCEDINEDLFSKCLFNELPPVDLLIRTSGEYRISNFMLWNLAYSEMYFTDTLWPDFSKKDLDKAIDSYYKRDRRYGSIKKSS